MARPVLVALLLAVLAACSAGPTPHWVKGGSTGGNTGPTWSKTSSTRAGRQILARAQAMVNGGIIIRGGCWDYINAVYNRAGYPEAKRREVFRTRKSGPYADPKLIQPGDWLYFVNHSYGGIEHSGIFVEWINIRTRQARMLSYAGEKRREPARYSPYDISDTYAIIRPKPD